MNDGIADRLDAFLAASSIVLGTTARCGDSATERPPPAPDPPRPTTVTITPATSHLTALGATIQLTAQLRDQNGQAMAGPMLTWGQQRHRDRHSLRTGQTRPPRGPRRPLRPARHHPRKPGPPSSTGTNLVGDPTFGDAILDRLLNNAHRITLKGTSMRKLYDSTKTDSTL